MRQTTVLPVLRVSGLCLFMALAGLVLGVSPSVAQTAATQPQVEQTPVVDPIIAGLPSNPDLISLYDLTWVNAVEQAALYEDPDRRANINDILARYAKGDRPRSTQSNLISVKDRNNPIWIVLPIINQSGSEHWVLDFGDRLQGRTSYYNGFFFYEHTSRKVLINALPDRSGNPLLLPDSSALPVTLPLRRPILFVMLLQPDGVSPILSPLTIRPDLNDESGLKQFWQNPPVHLTLMALIAGFFLAAGLLAQRWGLALISVYLSSLSMTSLLSPQTMFVAPGSMSPLVATLGPMIQGIFLLLTVWFIFQGSGARMANPILLIAGVAIQVIGIAMVLLYPPLFPGVPAMAAFIMLAAPVISILLCIHQTRQGDLSGLHLMIVSIIQLCALLIAFGAEYHSGLPSSPITLNAVLLSLLPQAVFFAAAMRAMPLQMGAMTGKIETRKRSSEDDEKLARLRHAKEGFDYNNLLKVIEHERRQLAEARDRESQRTEEMRRAKEAADEANRAKSAFLAVISHEIRTPMTGVMGMVKMLQDTTLTKDQTEFVSTIKESGNAMMSLLNDILDFEKIESGKMQLEKIDFDLHRLINSVATLMNGHATSKSIQLNVEKDASVPQYVIGDMSRLRQVLLNLVGNAIKFTKQGSVTIRLSSTLQSGNGKSHQIYFAVQDTGIGISREAQKNIFNPFAQADATISRKFGGSGLGLAISKRLIEAMGSQINISSREGEGTTFFFTLSMPEGSAELAEDAQSVPSPSPSPVSTRHMNVLVVEDNEITQRVIKALLEQHGHHPTAAESGEVALKILRDGQAFDLILSDIQMNGMSGHEFARQVRLLDAKGQANTPIVALTGNVDQSDIQKCYEAGMNDHLAKPIDPDKFNEILNAVESRNFRNTVITKHPIDFQPTVEQAYETLRSGATFTPPETPDETDDTYRTDNGGFDSFAHALDQSPTEGQAPDPSNPVFQTDMLETLKESLGVEQLEEMLEGLFSKAEEIITILGLTPEPYNLEDVRARAHELKGMCGNFGLMALSKQAAEIEKLAKNGIAEGIGDMIGKLQPLYATGRLAIDAWLKE